MYKKKIFLFTFFEHISTFDLAWTKCRLVTKHVLSITYFHSCFFLTFPFKFYLYIKFKLFITDYMLLIYSLMCLIIFLRLIISFGTEYLLYFLIFFRKDLLIAGRSLDLQENTLFYSILFLSWTIFSLTTLLLVTCPTTFVLHSTLFMVGCQAVKSHYPDKLFYH